ncbi:phosphotransferase [Streptomyces syringium]|uniref:phosphotransferase n=1 Tax=Streptomyces syringium TaxID=76729 RepID=UPI0034563275
MRATWEALPEETRAAVVGRSGQVRAAEDVPHGVTCRFAAVLSTARGRLFAKGVPADDARGAAARAWEVALNPLVAGPSPRLLWPVAAGGWDVLGFEWVDGRHADLAPGSADLAPVAEALMAVQGVRAPTGVPLLAGRWPDLDDIDRELLAGDALLHTDTNPHNLLISDDGRAWVVDWAMPAAGPAWMDVAYTAVRLMEEGQDPGEALRWAAQFPSWAAADPTAVEALVRLTCRRRTARVGERGARGSNGRFEALLGARHFTAR